MYRYATEKTQGGRIHAFLYPRVNSNYFCALLVALLDQGHRLLDQFFSNKLMIATTQINQAIEALKQSRLSSVDDTDIHCNCSPASFAFQLSTN